MSRFNYDELFTRCSRGVYFPNSLSGTRNNSLLSCLLSSNVQQTLILLRCNSTVACLFEVSDVCPCTPTPRVFIFPIPHRLTSCIHGYGTPAQLPTIPHCWLPWYFMYDPADSPALPGYFSDSETREYASVLRIPGDRCYEL
jgi:hypothetical protein